MKSIIVTFILINAVNFVLADTDPRCPSNNDGYVTLLPHDNDCTKFYKCEMGKKILQSCPANLHFNAAAGACDWPENANCGSVENTPPPSDSRCALHNHRPYVRHEYDCSRYYKCEAGVAIEQRCPPGLEFNAFLMICQTPDLANCSNRKNKIIPASVESDPRCALHNHRPYVRHEYDCSRYYKCEAGEAIEQRCAPGLEFNALEMVCQSPELANCSGGSVDNTPPPVEFDPRCTLHMNGKYLPHEYDCTMYYKCEMGVAVIQSCPPGLDFNSVTQICQEPENANCSVGGGVNGPCPVDNNGFAIHFPDEKDCNKFYVCDWGQLVSLSCPTTLHFNAVLRVCDWPEQADCRF